MKKKAAPKKRAAKKAATYSLSLSIGDKTYTSSADTIFDALMAIEPVKMTFKGKLVASKGDFTRELLISVPNLRKMFGRGRFLKEMYAKRLSTLVG